MDADLDTLATALYVTSTTCYSKHPTWRHGGHRWGSRPSSATPSC